MVKKILRQKNFSTKNFGVKKNLGSKKILCPKSFKVKKNQVQKYLISCGSLSLKFHAILLARSGVMEFVSVEQSRVVLVKINEMALKVPSQFLMPDGAKYLWLYNIG